MPCRSRGKIQVLEPSSQTAGELLALLMVAVSEAVKMVIRGIFISMNSALFFFLTSYKQRSNADEIPDLVTVNGTGAMPRS